VQAAQPIVHLQRWLARVFGAETRHPSTYTAVPEIIVG
jgi:hypothetical protein